MRFIAKFRRYKVPARPHVSLKLANNKEDIVQNGVLCEFQQGFQLLPHEKELAALRFKFTGITTEEDEMTILDPVYGPDPRISLYDTDWPHLNKQWTLWERTEKDLEGKLLVPGTIRREVEEFLVSYHMHGRDYLLVEPIVVDPPYPRYAAQRRLQGQRKVEHAIREILATYETAGFDLDAALAYERQEGNSPEVLAALEGLRPKEEEPEPLIAA